MVKTDRGNGPVEQHHIMKITHPILLAIVTLLLLPAVHAGSSIEQSRAMWKDGLLKVENAAGSIEITSWDKDEVRISGELGDDVEDLEILETSSGVEIR